MTRVRRTDKYRKTAQAIYAFLAVVGLYALIYPLAWDHLLGHPTGLWVWHWLAVVIFFFVFGIGFVKFDRRFLVEVTVEENHA